MRYSELIEKLSIIDIKNIMQELGSDCRKINDNNYAFKTICHGGHKHKLIYFLNDNVFYCFTECNKAFNIIDLVSRVKKISATEAYYWICSKVGINTGFLILQEGFEEDETDISFIYKFLKKNQQQVQLIYRDESILDNFNRFFHKSWLDDNISKMAMYKFNIRYHIYDNQIVIPHYDIDGNLLGIRVRNLNEKEVEKGKKYMPITYRKVLYNYPTSMNLYGLWINKENIKKYKKVIIFESEKAVLQHYSYYPDKSIAVAISGSFLHDYQIDLLKKLGVETIILGLDKEFEELMSDEDLKNRVKIRKKFYDRLKMYFNFELIYDKMNLLNFKDAPTDRGVEIFEKLMKNRIIF